MESVGIIDIGSNTVRLSVVELRPDGAYRVRHEQKAGLRLADRLGPERVLGPVAAAETSRILSAFAAAGADWQVGLWLAVGTAAVRQAVDGAAFLHTVAEGTGITPRLLGGEEEARLGLIGALNTLAETEGFAVDVGGASTEVTRFTDRRRTASLSLPLGAVNATARFGFGEAAPAAALEALRAALDAEATAAQWLRPTPGATLIGIGGTVRSISKLDRKRRGYPLHATHNYALDPAEVLDLAERLAVMSARDRERLPGLEPERADLIAAGAALLGWVITRLEPARLIVSGAGLREGLFFSHLLRDRAEPLFPDVLEASTENLERLHGLPEVRARRLGALAAALWDQLGPLVGAPAAAARLVPPAARLREVGSALSYYDWEQHTFYLLREARLYGLDHRERLLLAAAASYAGPGRVREHLQPFGSLLAPGDERLAVRMGVTAALTHAVDRACRGAALPLEVAAVPSAVRLTPATPPLDGALAPATLAEDFRKAFGRALGLGPAPGA